MQWRALYGDQGGLVGDGAARLQGVLQGVLQVAACDGCRVVHQVLSRALRHHHAAARTGSGAYVDNMRGPPYGVFVVLDHHQCVAVARSEEHTSELQSLMRISYAVFCLKKKKTKPTEKNHKYTHDYLIKK